MMHCATFTIPLTSNQQALVDQRDWHRLRRFRWHAYWNSKTRSYYAAANGRRAHGRGARTFAMHRVIMRLRRGDRRQVDHINHSTLDNRRCNLRVVNQHGNSENRRDQSPWGAGIDRRSDLRSKPFSARVLLAGRMRYLGYFATAAEAREARRCFLEDHNEP